MQLLASQPVTSRASTVHRYPAEKGHQDYYRRNKSGNPYCRLVIHPKLAKVKPVMDTWMGGQATLPVPCREPSFLDSFAEASHSDAGARSFPVLPSCPTS